MGYGFPLRAARLRDQVARRRLRAAEPRVNIVLRRQYEKPIHRRCNTSVSSFPPLSLARRSVSLAETERRGDGARNGTARIDFRPTAPRICISPGSHPGGGQHSLAGQVIGREINHQSYAGAGIGSPERARQSRPVCRIGAAVADRRRARPPGRQRPDAVSQRRCRQCRCPTRPPPGRCAADRDRQHGSESARRAAERLGCCVGPRRRADRGHACRRERGDRRDPGPPSARRCSMATSSSPPPPAGSCYSAVSAWSDRDAPATHPDSCWPGGGQHAAGEGA